MQMASLYGQYRPRACFCPPASLLLVGAHLALLERELVAYQARIQRLHSGAARMKVRLLVPLRFASCVRFCQRSVWTPPTQASALGAAVLVASAHNKASAFLQVHSAVALISSRRRLVSCATALAGTSPSRAAPGRLSLARASTLAARRALRHASIYAHGRRIVLSTRSWAMSCCRRRISIETSRLSRVDTVTLFFISSIDFDIVPTASSWSARRISERPDGLSDRQASFGSVASLRTATPADR